MRRLLSAYMVTLPYCGRYSSIIFLLPHLHHFRRFLYSSRSALHQDLLSDWQAARRLKARTTRKLKKQGHSVILSRGEHITTRGLGAVLWCFRLYHMLFTVLRQTPDRWISRWFSRTANTTTRADAQRCQLSLLNFPGRVQLGDEAAYRS
jgi:hypothetical protein